MCKLWEFKEDCTIWKRSIQLQATVLYHEMWRRALFRARHMQPSCTNNVLACVTRVKLMNFVILFSSWFFTRLGLCFQRLALTLTHKWPNYRTLCWGIFKLTVSLYGGLPEISKPIEELAVYNFTSNVPTSSFVSTEYHEISRFPLFLVTSSVHFLS